MNPLLAQIYGLDKTASADDGSIDLDNISGAQLLAGLESGEIVLEGDEEIEKEAGDEEIDLSQFTGTELLSLLEEMEEGTEKVASDADYWEQAGRSFAGGYADEMNKVASIPDVIDLDEIDGQTMVELIESGEYELVDNEDLEKEAKMRPAARMEQAFRWIGERTSGQGAKNRAFNVGREKAVKATAKASKKDYKALRAGGMTPAEMYRAGGMSGKGRPQYDAAGSRAQKEFVRRRGRNVAAGTAALAVPTFLAGGVALKRRRRR
tara:strand:- start:61 stop:855 length:795 start_codon:yes stop_codon:yes gene_type:complete